MRGTIRTRARNRGNAGPYAGAASISGLFRKFGCSSLLFALFAVIWPVTACANPIFEDDFSGPSLDLDKWDFHVVWLAPTQMRDAAHAGAIVMTGDTVMLPLETHNPTANEPGDSFYGTDITTKESFEIGDGICFEARIRLVDSLVSPLRRGYIGAGFLFEDTAGATWDEIDAPEILSNNADDVRNGHESSRGVITNVFDDYPLNPDAPEFVLLPPKTSLTDFTTYRTCVFPDRVEWYIFDENEIPLPVRTETGVVPDAAMNVHFNIHVPSEDFGDAYDPDLQPVPTPGENETFYLEVDHVKVIPEPDTDLMLVAGIAALSVLSRVPRIG
jgi:hypothetical protein